LPLEYLHLEAPSQNMYKNRISNLLSLFDLEVPLCLADNVLLAPADDGTMLATERQGLELNIHNHERDNYHCHWMPR
jgi:hypothetical protein